MLGGTVGEVREMRGNERRGSRGMREVASEVAMWGREVRGNEGAVGLGQVEGKEVVEG